MNAARIFAPFGLSAVLFILSYLSSINSNSGLFPVMLLAIWPIAIEVSSSEDVDKLRKTITELEAKLEELKAKMD